MPSTSEKSEGSTPPFLQGHPQLSILPWPGENAREYRVQNWQFSRTGQPRHCLVGMRFEAFLLLILGALNYWIWNTQNDWRISVSYYLSPAVVIFILYSTSGKLVSESIVALPPHGIQTESHYGIPATIIPRPIIIFTRRRFIPISSIKDIFINEGIRRWGFRYYLTILHTRNDEKGDVYIEVGFENILPSFAVVEEVYHGLRESLFNIESSTIDAPPDHN